MLQETEILHDGLRSLSLCTASKDMYIHANVFAGDRMRLNLQLAERRVLMLVQQEGPKDAEDIADELRISLGEVREAIATLSEEDLVTTPDQTVAELTDFGEKYDLLCDESIDDELGRLIGCTAELLRYIQETERHPVTLQSLAIHLDRQEYEVAGAADALEGLGYPVRKIIS